MNDRPVLTAGRLRMLEQTALRHRTEVYRHLAEQGPVRWVEEFDAYFVLGAAEAMEVLRQPDVFSSSIARGRGAMQVEDQVRQLAVSAPDMRDLAERGYGRAGDVRAGSTADPPVHTRQRALIAPAFSPRRIGSFEPLIRSVATALVRGLRGHQEADMTAEFTQPLPLRVLADVLGVRPEHVDDYARWSVGLLKPVGRPSVPPDELEDMVRCRKEFDRYFTEVIFDRLDRPRDDFMTDFAAGATSGESPLCLDEMLAMVEQFVIAGHETTTKLLGSALVILMEHPSLQEELRDRPELLDAFFDEVLRLESPAQMVHRLATRDTVVGGVAIPADSAVTVVLASANRDPWVFSAPDDLDLHRHNGRSHFGFGFGAHFCVGHALARLEARVALEVLLGALRSLRFTTPDGRDGIEYLATTAMHGPARLPVRYEFRDGVPEAAI